MAQEVAQHLLQLLLVLLLHLLQMVHVEEGAVVMVLALTQVNVVLNGDGVERQVSTAVVIRHQVLLQLLLALLLHLL